MFFDVCVSQRMGLYIVLTSKGKVAMQASKRCMDQMEEGRKEKTSYYEG